MKKFKKQFLRDVLKFTEEEVKLVMEAQEKFPELLAAEENLENRFVIKGETLCRQLEVRDNYNTWLLGETRFDIKGHIKWQGKLIKYRCVENKDFMVDWDSPNGNKFTKEKIRVMSSQKRSSYGIKNIITLTLNCAKKIAMRQNNEMGDLVCDYFILMEKAIKKGIDWEKVRHPERKGYKEMCSVLTKKFYILYPTQKMDRTIFQDNADMLNIALLGVKAKEIKEQLGYEDNNTREHLEIEVNKALYELQMLNGSLILADVDFATRENIIINTCRFKYDKLKMDCYREVM